MDYTKWTREEDGLTGRLRLTFALLTALVPLAARADFGYTASGELGHFSRIYIPSGDLFEAGPVNEAMSGLALSPSGELFGVAWNPNNTPSRYLVQVEPNTGVVDVRGPLAITTALWLADFGLAFDALGRLWLTTSEGLLYQVDPANGVATLRHDLGVASRGLAGCGRSLFTLTHPADSITPVQVMQIDPDTGSTTKLGAGTADVWAIDGAGLDFSSDGRLWAVLHNIPPFEFATGFFAEFSPTAGSLLASRVYGGDLDGLAIAPPLASCPGRGVMDVPGLSPLGLVLLAGLLSGAGAFLLRRRAAGVTRVARSPQKP
jgi:hypothetical protein